MRITSSCLVLLLALAPSLSNAQGSKSQSAPAPQSAAPAAKDEKLDVTDLEKKYWAAKDSDFNVVQNRLFSKANRFSLSASYGAAINESWSEGTTMGLNLGYFFNERWGVELEATKSDSKDNKAVQRLMGQSGYPNHNLMKDFYGAKVNWVPFYAKMSFLNSSIIYFDMGLALGAGVTSYEQQMDDGVATKSAPTLTLDLSQQFFLNKWLAIRLDYKNRFYSEDIQWYRKSSIPGGVNGNRTDSSDLNHTSILMGGLTFYW